MDDPNAPSLWLLMGLGMLLMGGFLLLLWGVNRLAGRPKSGEEETPAIVSRPIGQDAPAAPPSLTSIIMSLLLGQAGPIEPVADRLQQAPQSEAQGVANTRNPVNAELSAQPLAQPIVPEAAREIIQFWTKIDAVERIIAGGKVGMVEAIEAVFECKRNGRPDSVYGRARAALQAREQPQYRPLTPEQEETRAALALE